MERFSVGRRTQTHQRVQAWKSALMAGVCLFVCHSPVCLLYFCLSVECVFLFKYSFVRSDEVKTSSAGTSLDKRALMAGVCVGMNRPVTASMYHQFLNVVTMSMTHFLINYWSMRPSAGFLCLRPLHPLGAEAAKYMMYEEPSLKA